MSLMKTLAKVAVGVLVAQGVKGMLSKKGSGSAGSGSVFGGTNSRSSKGGLDDIMGDVLGGGTKRASGGTSFDDELGKFGGKTAGTGGGFGDLLDSLGGGRPGSSAGGGLDDVIGQMGKGGGGLGDLLGGILGGAAAGRAAAPQASPRDAAIGQAQGSRTMRDRLNQAFEKEGEAEIDPTPEQDAAAALLLRAMIQAAKSDGRIDEKEKQKILGNLGDASPDEIAFVKQELAATIDIDGLARQVPEGMAAQVYGVSVMAIDLDQKKEAQYLHALAQALGIDRSTANHIHQKVGAPALYS